MPTLGPYCRPAGRGRQQSAAPGKIGIFLIEDGHAHRIGDADDLLNHRPQRLVKHPLRRGSPPAPGNPWPGHASRLARCLAALYLSSVGPVTAKLIVAIDDSGLLGSMELDELAESLLSDEVVAVFPLAWVSPEWLEFDTAEGTTRTVKVRDDMVARDRWRLEPPPRRWAAARALRNDPGRLDGLLEGADGLPPRHRDALLQGLLDAAASLAAGQRRQLVRRALRSGIARVRRAALDQLCELDGPEAALRRAASDADQTVRAWRPPRGPEPGQLQLPGMAL